MDSRVVFLCGGQGSQFFGMGQTLYDAEPLFRRELQVLDKMAQPLLGHSVLEVLFAHDRTSADPLDNLRVSHPAIFMIEVSLARTLSALGLAPDVVVGASLGEFSALVISGAISAEAALRACVSQAETLIARCDEGRMVAVLEDVQLFHREAWLHQGVWLAAVNFARHFVISGPMDRCGRLEDLCRKRNILTQVLPVRQAFHSPLMDGAKDEYLRAVESLPVGRPQVQVFSATQKKTVEEPTPRHFWDAVREPIDLVEAWNRLEHFLPCTVVDLTPGGTLATFFKHHCNARKAKRFQCFSIVTPFKTDSAALARLVEHHRLTTGP